jgi:dienelactone hydrolase
MTAPARARRSSPCGPVQCALLAAALVVLTGCGGGDDDVQGAGSMSVPPVALPGPYVVACSNVAQDFARAATGEQAQAHWEAQPAADGSPRYVADLLTDPANTLQVRVDAPNDSNLFGSFAGRSLDFVVLACYPTVPTNARPGFALPTGQTVPHMHTGAEAPLFADNAVRYPLVAFSHGYAGSPLSDDHFVLLSWLASHGYVVVAPFHGDPRFSNLRIDDFRDALKVLTQLSDAVAMQALRPLAVSAALDLLLGHPQWRDHLDATRIGGFGASMGGETMLLLGGAALTTSPGLSSTKVGADTRIKAAVGYVPYFGQPLLPAFGRDQQGLDGVRLPYLGIAGTADTTAPLQLTRQGVERQAGERMLVTLGGLQHGFDPASGPDVMTWTLSFLDAMVLGVPAAMQKLSTMARVEGGGDDKVLIPLKGP